MITRDVDKQIAELTRQYKKTLTDRHREITALKQQLEESDWKDSALVHQLYQLIHKLAGSAGSYGFDKISEVAIDIDSQIKTYKVGNGLDKEKMSTDLHRLLEQINSLD